MRKHYKITKQANIRYILEVLLWLFGFINGSALVSGIIYVVFSLIYGQWKKFTISEPWIICITVPGMIATYWIYRKRKNEEKESFGK